MGEGPRSHVQRQLFCRSCGEQVPDDASFCPACGAPASQAPPLVTPDSPPLTVSAAGDFLGEAKASALGVSSKGLGRPRYDLYFTESRVVGVRLGGTGTGILLGGVVGGYVQQKYKESEEKRKKKEAGPETLDELMARHKNSFQAAYASVKSVKLHHRSLGARSLDLVLEDGEKKSFSGLDKEAFEKLKEALQRIAALQSKVEIAG